jgi:glutathione peroxidase
MGGLLAKIFFKTGYDKKNSLKDVSQPLKALSCKDIDGKDGVIGDYMEGKKATIFVNVACSCGLTSDHYKQLVEIDAKYKDKGVQILAFPCNQFKNQESKIESEIKKYVEDNFKAQFPIFSKIEVNGPNTDRIFIYLKTNTPEFVDKEKGLKNIPWNFAKFLVNEKGEVIRYFSPKENPSEMITHIEKLL